VKSQPKQRGKVLPQQKKVTSFKRSSFLRH
jgi:hypothetical protein